MRARSFVPITETHQETTFVKEEIMTDETMAFAFFLIGGALIYMTIKALRAHHALADARETLVYVRSDLDRARRDVREAQAPRKEHEVVHTACVFAEMWELFICDHIAVLRNNGWENEAQQIRESMNKFYQYVATTSPKEETSE
jgi:hypothetical protein